MRRAILMSMLILISLHSVSATEYDSNQNLSANGSLSGNHTVSNGATLEISGNYNIEDGSNFLVEEGSTMIVSGEMNANAPPQLNIDPQTEMVVPIGNLGPEGIMRIIFAEEVYYNITIEINNESFEWKGETFNYTMDMDVDNITVNFTHTGFWLIAISEIQLSPTGSTPEIRTPDVLTGNGTSYVIPDRNKAWTIDVYGDLEVTGNIYGAEINCFGNCTITNADLTSTGPINVYGSLAITGSSLSGGISDEDVIVWDDAEITWDSSTGTGGTTDNWIRLLSSRTIGVQNSHVTFRGYGLGYDAVDSSQITDNSTGNFANYGDHVIEIGYNERVRIIEWQDGNGDIYQESASGELVLSTPWGIYTKNIADLPRVNHFDMEIDLPLLSFDSLAESDDENSVNSRLGVMATVSNQGLAPATFLVDCFSNGVEANVGVNVPYTVGAGETIEIPMNWDSAVEGDLTLECSIFVPYQLYSIEVLDPTASSASTGVVSWEEVDDESSSMIIPIAMGIVLAVVCYVGFMIYSRSKDEIDFEGDSDVVPESDDEVGTIE